MKEFNTLFGYYCKGYLNEYHALEDIKPRHYRDHKTFKIDYFFEYIGKKNVYIKVILNSTKAIIPIVEPFLYVAVLLRQLIYAIVRRRKCNPATLHDKIVFFFFYKEKKRVEPLLSSVEMNFNELCLLTSPFTKTDLPKSQSLNILALLDYSEILRAFVWSLKTCFMISFRFWKDDFLFRTYNSFEYYLVYFSLNHIDKSNTLLFIQLIDRWVYLFGSRPHKKIYIQHGILNRRIEQERCGDVDIAYFINKEQEQLCYKKLFNQVKDVRYRKGIEIKPIQKEKDIKYILLICNSIFIKIEEAFIENLIDANVHLLMKLHPKDVGGRIYQDLQAKYNIETVSYFPDVDIVISYDSSLADEYRDYGKEVIKYTPDCNNSDIKQIVNKLKKRL